MPLRPGFTASTFALELGGVDAGFARSATGGEAFGVVAEEPATSARTGKHIAAIGYAPIVVEVAAPLAPPLAEWVASMLDGTQSARDGAVTTVDANRKVRSRLEWRAALISEVVFPSADGASKEPAAVRVTIEPEQTVRVDGSGGSHPSTLGTKQKAFLPSNFRFEISGLEAVGKRVSKVSALTATRRPGVLVGEFRETAATAGAIAVADVVLSISPTDVAPYASWFDDFVINGNSGAERTGSLSFLDPALKNELLRLDLDGLGITRISYDAETTGADTPARVRVGLYCEAIRLAKLA